MFIVHFLILYNTWLSKLKMLIVWHMITPWSRFCYFSYFTGEEAEASKGYLTCPKQESRPGFGPGSDVTNYNHHNYAGLHCLPSHRSLSCDQPVGHIKQVYPIFTHCTKKKC